MSKIHTNSGKSVKERLLNLSGAEHYNPQMMISRYMQERLLYRLSISKSTFTNRETGYRENHPLFTEEFFASKDRQSFWNGFLRKIKYPESIDFQDIGLLIRKRLQPCWESLRDDSIL